VTPHLAVCDGRGGSEGRREQLVLGAKAPVQRPFRDPGRIDDAADADDVDAVSVKELGGNLGNVLGGGPAFDTWHDAASSRGRLSIQRLQSYYGLPREHTR
jgi:hypothetical protein